jgi:hypothetical protein
MLALTPCPALIDGNKAASQLSRRSLFYAYSRSNYFLDAPVTTYTQSKPQSGTNMDLGTV